MEAARSSFEDFQFVRVLGKGSWGTVSLALRKKDGLPYAIKTVVLANRAKKDQMAAVKEAQLLASLDSPHITKYYDSFLHEGLMRIVMEYAPGGSLHAAIGRACRPLPEDLIWRVLLHTALALHHMHGRRMLHRDVKSLNIFIRDQGRQPQFMLGDVGVAKVLDQDKNCASTMIGTPYYLSPEICQEKPYDAKSDIWALGVVLYECATRRHPFDAQSQPSLIMKILRGRYDPVLGVSADLAALIDRCLNQAAARRPSAERLLSLPLVRAKAAELGIELPPLAAPAVSAPTGPPVSALAAAEGLAGRPPRRRTVQERPVGAAPAGARSPRPAPERPACPAGPSGPDGYAMPPTGAWSTGAAARQLRRHSSGGDKCKPPLPPAAVPTRRRTVQPGAGRGAPLPAPAAAAARNPRTVPNSPGAGQLLQAASPRSPRQQRPAAAAAALAAAGQQPLLAPAAAAAPAAIGAGREGGSSPRYSPRRGGTHKLSPRRESHFSVQQHLQELSSAAQQWLVQRGSSSGGGGASGGAAIGPGSLEPSASAIAGERSAKSDSSLLQMQHAARAVRQEQAAAAAAAASGAALAELRQRCVALLGSEALFQELNGLAKAAVDSDGAGAGSNGSNSATEATAGAGAATPGAAGPSTLAALGDLLFERVGYSGHAAEALHALLKMLYYES